MILSSPILMLKNPHLMRIFKHDAKSLRLKENDASRMSPPRLEATLRGLAQTRFFIVMIMIIVVITMLIMNIIASMVVVVVVPMMMMILFLPGRIGIDRREQHHLGQPLPRLALHRIEVGEKWPRWAGRKR